MKNMFGFDCHVIDLSLSTIARTMVQLTFPVKSVWQFPSSSSKLVRSRSCFQPLKGEGQRIEEDHLISMIAKHRSRPISASMEQQTILLLRRSVDVAELIGFINDIVRERPISAGLRKNQVQNTTSSTIRQRS